jgi:hypothetical protein
MMTRASGTPWLLDGDENPLAPPSVVAGLQEINPRLGLQYHVALRAFLVTLKWPEDDARRAMIRDGVLAPNTDFEILCPVPANVSLDEVQAWVAQQLVRVSANREDVRRMVADHEDRIAKQNAAVITTKQDEAKHDLIENLTKPSTVGSRRTRVK